MGQAFRVAFCQACELDVLFDRVQWWYLVLAVVKLLALLPLWSLVADRSGCSVTKCMFPYFEVTRVQTDVRYTDGSHDRSGVEPHDDRAIERFDTDDVTVCGGVFGGLFFLLVAITTLRRAIFSFVLSVRLYVWKSSAPARRIFMEI